MPDSEIRLITRELGQTLRGLRTSFVELQLKVTEYINKFDERTEFIEKIFKIKELIKNHELKSKTNFLELLQTTPTALMHNRKKDIFNTKLSTETIYEFDFKEKALSLNEKVLSNTKMVEKAPKIEIPEDEVEESDAINMYELFNEFKACGIDMFSFIEHKEFEITMGLEEKIELFLKLISEFDSILEIQENYILKEEYEIAKVYIKRDY